MMNLVLQSSTGSVSEPLSSSLVLFFLYGLIKLWVFWFVGGLKSLLVRCACSGTPFVAAFPNLVEVVAV